MINIFNSNYEELGSLNKNLVLLTLGKIKIRYGKKFIDLLDNNGNINVLIPKVLKKVDSVDKMNTNGLYLIGDELWAYVDGEKILVEGEANKTFISYLSNLNLDLSLIDTALKNIGLKFDSLGEVNVNNSIVFVQDKIYYISNGNAIELTTTLNEPLKSINSSGLGSGAENSVLYFKNGRWTYAPLPTGDNTLQITLNEPIEGLNNANLGEPENGKILAYQNNAWSYINIPTGNTGVLLNSVLSDINNTSLTSNLSAYLISQEGYNQVSFLGYHDGVWKIILLNNIPSPTLNHINYWWSLSDMNNGGNIYYTLYYLNNDNNIQLPGTKYPSISSEFEIPNKTCYKIPNSDYYPGSKNIIPEYSICTGFVLYDNNNYYATWDIPLINVYLKTRYNDTNTTVEKLGEYLRGTYVPSNTIIPQKREYNPEHSKTYYTTGWADDFGVDIFSKLLLNLNEITGGYKGLLFKGIWKSYEIIAKYVTYYNSYENFNDTDNPPTVASDSVIIQFSVKLQTEDGMYKYPVDSLNATLSYSVTYDLGSSTNLSVLVEEKENEFVGPVYSQVIGLKFPENYMTDYEKIYHVKFTISNNDFTIYKTLSFTQSRGTL